MEKTAVKSAATVFLILVSIAATIHSSLGSGGPAVYESTSQNVTGASVYLGLLPATVEAGNPIAITWTVYNVGTSTLNDFNTSIHIDNILLASQHVDLMDANASQAFQTVWNTSDSLAGNHAVIASVQPFPNETDLLDNTFTAQVELTTVQPSRGMDDTNTTSWFGRKIELYDQYPAPYGGQAANMSSAMFRPQQQVELYANVTYNRWPVPGGDVAFEIVDNDDQVVTILVARTDTNGVAHTYYRMPWQGDYPENLFGVWTVAATVEIAGIVVSDTLKFHFDYLVEIFKVVTDTYEYDQGDNVAVTIDYGSHAQQTYPLVFWVVIKDNLEVPIAQVSAYATVGGAVFSEYKNDTATFIIHIPENVHAGIARIYVNAYNALPTQGGSPWCPTYGLINPFGYAWPTGSVLPQITILAHDLQVLNVTAFPQEVAQGETVDIDVTVRNNGNSTASSTLRTYYGNSVIQETNLTKLVPSSEQVLHYQWDTGNVPQGTYQIIATVDPVRGETSIEDNTYYGNCVRILPQQIKTGRDIAITSLTAAPTITEAKTPIAITARVKNFGNQTETFNVAFYANTSKIGIKTVTQLKRDSDATLSLTWDTSNVNPGDYTIWALAEHLPEETNETNNMLTDGTVTLLEPSVGPTTSSLDWAALIPVFAIALLTALVLLLILYYLKRRGEKKPSRSGYVIISHTHI